MEYYGFLEELLALRSSSDSWEANIVPMGIMNKNNDGYCYNNNSSNFWNNYNNFSVVEENQILMPILPSSFQEYTNFCPFEQQSLMNSPTFFNATKDSHSSEFSPQLTESSNTKLDTTTPQFPCYQEELLSSSIFDEEACFHHSCKIEPAVYNQFCDAQCPVTPLLQNGSFSIGSVGPEKKPKSKKLHGQPSKNLMAERRRRKRLNDRLSMLRSIVPKISKMDRTSILGDTIDYMKELLERINHLQEEMEVGPEQLRLMSIFKDVKPDEMSVRNSPKFDVERRGISDTRVEICCSAKPGLLLSTVTTLEALGLEIQQCVISCFNDFAMRASCTQELEQGEVLNSEDIKQALFRNAGYGGRCL